MKIRTFFITFLSPCVLLLFAMQIALVFVNSEECWKENVSSLEMKIFIEDSASNDRLYEIVTEVSSITNSNITVVSANEELERFKSEFSVDIMNVLLENPFGRSLVCNLGENEDFDIIKFKISKIKEVKTIIYPVEDRNKIENEYNETRKKLIVLSIILGLIIILQCWMSEHFECTANEPQISKALDAKKTRKDISVVFKKRAFVKGILIGVAAAVVLFLSFFAISMNAQVNLYIDYYVITLVASFGVILSVILTYIMQLIAFNVSFKKSK